MKSLPRQPRIDTLEHEASMLQQLHDASDPSFCARLKACEPSYESRSDEDILREAFTMDDARRILAREYGYSSWASLKAYVDSLQLPMYHMVSARAAYHRVITNSYDARSKNYDGSAWHRDVALKTVRYWPPETGQQVLDIGTGTGAAAFHCAELVGETGHVIGVDISSGMLEKCREKLAESKLTNLEFAYGDGEHLEYAPNRFDRIYCANAIFWMSNLQAAFRHWYELLKPGGVVGFNASPSSSFFWGSAVRKALATVGIDFICNIPAGDEDNAREMLECAGFINFQMHAVPNGKYVSVEDAKSPPFITLETYAPGQYPHPIQDISPELMQRAQQAYDEEVDKHATEQGVWHDMTQYYFYGQKPLHRP